MSGDPRLPARLEIGALIRLAETQGGFAAVLRAGHDEAGTILLVLTEKGENPRVYERLPQLDGCRVWSCIKAQATDIKAEITTYLDRRAAQDSDLWIVELDIAQGEQLIGLPKGNG